jgi:hypothetical protein
MKLFFTAFIQVFLVSVNVIFISRYYYLGIAIVAFLISFTWSFNVSKISVGSVRDKIIYSTGAMLGSLSGVFITHVIL